MGFEYTVVELTETPVAKRHEVWGQIINEVTKHGWRLHQVTTEPGQFGKRMYAFFERQQQ